MAHQTLTKHEPKSGDRVLIRPNSCSPYAGQIGIVVEINHEDAYGPILVRFSDGLQFRYRESELLPLVLSASSSSHSSQEVA
jgi:hypothetical protein